jgi:hypothetical protein
LERIKRFTEAVADLMESHTTQGRNVARLLDLQGQQLGRIEVALHTLSSDVRALAAHVHELASEQILLGNRVENAFSERLTQNDFAMKNRIVSGHRRRMSAPARRDDKDCKYGLRDFSG